ncbi:hypothetical protein [Actimicrobium sp. CCI2.3]|uniref:hypothetical protein n=1 Tax=Actimicrobium sp. CCI2.3 TaxID=3048616 RepID=UPI002AB3D9B7|nr:hypothetical protein [Actimicrobium sp. CCI2.3]MDY7574223.1 hypothetical protein [Actimicrobium sp. CCI2.3]MEB0022777.1 hypothetical protein [Actimicrobium sp. CCI2.3]
MGQHQDHDFDTLISQPFGRSPQLFLHNAAANSAGLANSASPSKEDFMLYKLLANVAAGVGVTVAIFISIVLYINADTSKPLSPVASALERCVEEKIKLLPAHEKVGGRVVFLEFCKKLKDKMK